jgi:transposase-like protein
MLQEIASRCKTPREMSQELRPHWDGYLLFDEKMCSIRGYQQWYYMAVDRTGDIIHCRQVRELTSTEAIAFLDEVKALPVTCRGIVTDMDQALTKAVGVVFPGKPHQYCLKHVLDSIDQRIGYTKIIHDRRSRTTALRREFERLPDRRWMWKQRSREEFMRHWKTTRPMTEQYKEIKALRDYAYRILFAKTELSAEERFEELRHAQGLPKKRQRNVVRFFQQHWDHLVAHHLTPGLPRTTNLIENVNKQVERRFKTIESFQYKWTSGSYMNLLIAYLRQKPYTDCRRSRRHLNGHSRLFAAGVRNLSKDWLKNCLKNA